LILSSVLTLAAVSPSARASSASEREIHVAPDGNDAASGTADHPLAHLERARDLIRQMKHSGGLPAGGVTVILHAGTYYLPETLAFTPEDSGTEQSPIVYEAAQDAKVIVSGGRPLTGWTNVKDDLWTLKLPEVRAGSWYFRQLFAGDSRLPRARLPEKGFYLTEGPLSAYAHVIKLRDFKDFPKLRPIHPDAYCGFNFKPGDITPWPDADDAEIITFHSWECSWQTIRHIDEGTHDVTFYSPCRYPVGAFTPHCPYRIENIIEGLTQPGEWQLDRKSGLLSYLARPGEDPNAESAVAAGAAAVTRRRERPRHRRRARDQRQRRRRRPRHRLWSRRRWKSWSFSRATTKPANTSTTSRCAASPSAMPIIRWAFTTSPPIGRPRC
jgi:hypothetical protein